MKIESFPPDAWEQLAETFSEHGVELPDPDLARILIARDETTDEIAGFVVVQLQPHIEPIYVAPKYRHQGLAGQLGEAAIALFPTGASYYAFSPRAGIDQLAAQLGLEKLQWHVYRGMN